MFSRSVLIPVALAALAGCSGGGADTASSGSSPPSPVVSTTTLVTTTTDPREEVKAAYLGYWAMVDRLVQAPDPNDPEIAERLTEPALSDFINDMATRVATGHHTTLPAPERNRHEVRSIEVAATSASVGDCFVDGRIVLDADGVVLNDDVVSKSLDARLTKTPRGWRISSVATITRQSGAVACAAR